MKRILSILICIIAICTMSFAQGQGFYMDVEDENISASDVINLLESKFDLPDKTTFSLFRDETDELGIRHISYQQKVDGIDVVNGIVLVHCKDNKIATINGDIMCANNSARMPKHLISRNHAALQVRRNRHSENDAELRIIKVSESDGFRYYYAYEVMAEDNTTKYYIDAESGEVIKTVPLVYYADVLGTAKTMYDGIQPITCFENDGQYYLIDDDRRIMTLNATSAAFDYSIMSIENFNTLPDSIIQFINNSPQTEEYALIIKNMIYSYMLQEFIKTCKQYQNNSSVWGESLSYIRQIKITDAGHDWWYSLTDRKPDLRIEIYSPQDELVYFSTTQDDNETPIFVLPHPFGVTAGSYIKIYDVDLTSEDYGGKIVIGDISSGIHKWKTNNTSGEIDIVDVNIPANSVHWGMQRTYDFYESTFNRHSFDNKYHPLYNFVDAQKDAKLFVSMPNQALGQDGYNPNFMAYGMGDNIIMGPVVDLDVMAHEFTHLVTANNGNGGLEYSGESGALNESFSDIMGVAVKRYVTGQNDWLIGNHLMIQYSNLRSMKNPKNSSDGTIPQPNTYKGPKGTYWQDTANPTDKNDHGGVHINSGVQNYWFYLLAEGGSGVNDLNNFYNVKGIGIEKAVQIAYRNLIYYLTPQATFHDSRNGSLAAAADLYGKNSQEYKSVADAWYAVGVGDKYLNTQARSITLKALMPNDWGSTISAWTWGTDNPGSWVKPTKKNGWYEYTINGTEMNVLFVNGATWSNENNQSEDITIDGDACVVVGGETDGKRSIRYVNCPHDITIIAKAPNDWGNTVSAWTWGNSNPGKFVQLSQENGWYKYSTYDSEANLIFVNGTTWNGDNNQTVDISLSDNTCVVLGNETNGKRSYRLSNCPEDITVKIKKPADWTKTITAWVWEDNQEGKFVTLKKEGNWYSYTQNCHSLNIIFVNGSAWSSDDNQTVDINTHSDACYQIESNTGKRHVTLVSCEDQGQPTDDIENNRNLVLKPRKVIENGNLYIILPDGRKFDANGKKVE